MRVGGSDTPWTGNWVVSGHTLHTKWGGQRTQTPKHKHNVGRLADTNPKAETWAVGGHTQWMNWGDSALTQRMKPPNLAAQVGKNKVGYGTHPA